MKGIFLILCFVLVLGLSACGAGPALSDETNGSITEMEIGMEKLAASMAAFAGAKDSGKSVSITFKDVPIRKALDMLSKEAEISYAIQGEIPEDLRVTANLQNASSKAAFELICDSAGLACDYNYVNKTFIVSVRPTATISGRRVPLLGAHVLGGGGGAVGNKPFFGSPYGENSLIREKMLRTGVPNQPFEEDGRLVSLEVKDADFRDAVYHLAEQAGVILLISDNVPKGLKVTAKIKDVMFDEALFYLTSQANLVYSVVETDDEKTVLRVSTVPVLQVMVSGVQGQPNCPKCGHVILSPDWKYCCECGTKLSHSK